MSTSRGAQSNHGVVGRGPPLRTYQRRRRCQDTVVKSEIKPSIAHHCSLKFIKQEAKVDETELLGVAEKQAVKIEIVNDQTEEWGVDPGLHLDKIKNEIVEQERNNQRRMRCQEDTVVKSEIKPSITHHCSLKFIKQEVEDDETELLGVAETQVVKIELVNDQTEEWGVGPGLHLDKIKDEIVEHERNNQRRLRCEDTVVKSEIKPSIAHHCSLKFIKQEVEDDETELLGVAETQVVKIELVNDQTEEWGVDPDLHLNKIKDETVEQERNKRELYLGHDVKAEIVIGPVMLQHPKTESASQKTNSGVVSGCEQATSIGTDQSRAVVDEGFAGDARRFQCTQCSKECYSNRALTIHMRVHTEEKPYSCDICSRTFKQKQHLKCHVLTHTGYKPHSSNICDKKLNPNSYLTVHTRERPYTCYICHKGFIKTSHLTDHVRIHNGDRPYQCHICLRKFTVNGTLTKHMRTHTDDKPYGCNICNKKYTSSYNLTQHKLMHTNYKPYRCDICYRKFPLNSSLRRHIMNHDSSNRSVCDICDKSFSTSSYLKVHMRMHTKEILSP